MATDRPSNYSAIPPLCLRIAETMDDAIRIVVNDGTTQAERGRKTYPWTPTSKTLGSREMV